MRVRLAAAAAGVMLTAAGVLAFSLSPHPLVAGHSAVEPLRPSAYLPAGARQCQALSRLPADADRMRLRVTYVTGGARQLRVEIQDRGGAITAGELDPVAPGDTIVNLHPRTRAAHPATICFSNPGPGQVNLGGDAKRLPEGPRGKSQKPLVASAIFVRPGESSWFAETGTIADRYANSQTGITGAWSLWLAVALAVLAGLTGLWWVVVKADGRD